MINQLVSLHKPTRWGRRRLSWLLVVVVVVAVIVIAIVLAFVARFQPNVTIDGAPKGLQCSLASTDPSPSGKGVGTGLEGRI
jgi:Na+/H+-dicarboxylate symporter